jgi:Domain of unknown function (DUF4157)
VSTRFETHKRPSHMPSVTRVRSSILQRKCACGRAAGPTGECAECGKKRALGLQPKLTVNQPGDAYEQEADRVADQVLTAPAHPSVSSAPMCIQRFTGQAAAGTDSAPASVDRVIASSGMPLEPALRQDMEQRFGHDFSHDFSRVRVHSDAQAAESARAVNALAYTVGRDVVFGRGQYAPATSDGRRLLAHELTHTLQQGEAPSASREGLVVSAPGYAAEREADQVTRLVSRQRPRKPTPLSPLVSSTSPYLARQSAGGKADPLTPEDRIRAELEKNVVEGDVEAIEQRRQRLREIFENVPPSKASVLHDQLSKGIKGDELARLFHLRLATATREEMLGILKLVVQANAQQEAEKKIEDELRIAGEAHTRATAVLDAVAVGDLDPDLIDQVRAQGESVQETMQSLTELKSILASVPEERRRITLRALSIESRVYAQSVGHLKLLHKIVSFEIPDRVYNYDEVEEKLDEYANVHGDLINDNEHVEGLAAYIADVGLGVEQQIETDSLLRTLDAIQAQTSKQDQTLKDTEEHVDQMLIEAKEIEDSILLTVLEAWMSIPGRGKKPRKPSRRRPKPKTRSKTSKRSAKTRRQFKKSRDAAKPEKARERRKKTEKRKERREKKRVGAYPICWPKYLLPDPIYRTGMLQLTFVRVQRAERDLQQAQRHRLRMEWRQAGEPDFDASKYHVHHIIPLFLGGPDYLQVNGIIWPKGPHLKGHSVLRYQRQLKDPRLTAPLPPISVDLYNRQHKAGTLYYFAGYKGFGPVCGAS